MTRLGVTHLVEDPTDVARALLAGHLAILPTETVYGLAARADDPAAVARLYAAKGRPSDHPVIVHAHDGAVLDPAAGWVRDAPAYAESLAAAYWPGPMTLVLMRGARAGDDVTGGQDTVAVRVPAHPRARAVLADMDRLDPAQAPHGVAAPSANRFGRVSPTTVRHALDELEGFLDADDVALDGGECDVGVESTIVDCTGARPRVLRPGAITAADVEHATGLAVEGAERSTVRASGGLRSHYAPRARVILRSDDDLGADPGWGLIAPSGVPTPAGVTRLLSALDSRDYAHGLYAALRRADQLGLEVVIAVPPPPDSTGLAEAVLDRLRRAAAG